MKPTLRTAPGKWVRSMGSRWWEGPCQCGSGKDGHEVYDHNGIYFGISCSACKREPAYYEPWEENIDNDY